MATHDTIRRITHRIAERSAISRRCYLENMAKAAASGRNRTKLACANLAHVAAATDAAEKRALLTANVANIAIVTAYNDMVSAHQPFERFPALIRDAARRHGAVAQVAGGVPAMCDGITQGADGMELSLFSRDTIALATVVALSHNAFDAALYLGVCDKIVPGLVMGALGFGHLPALFVPGGPMPSGLPNPEKSRIRQLYAEGKVDREALLDAEVRSYHSAGTCTFYGTANSNQMLMEIMGLHLPGASFVNPNTPLRDALTAAATTRVIALSPPRNEAVSLCRILDERAFVNGIIGLLATGGSTNHTMHLVAMARCAGIILSWDDFADLSSVIPLLVRAYPNGNADINHFHAAGGMGYLISTLLSAGLLNDDAETIMGTGLEAYTEEPWLDDGELAWRPAASTSGDDTVLRPAAAPFQPTGGLSLLSGNLGRAVMKVSAILPQHRVVKAPARVFASQSALLKAHASGALEQDFIAVLPFQGPKACGMPELHKLTSALGALQDRGFRVALLTDGRMSGASGKVAAAIHVTPEAVDGGLIAKIRDGDLLVIDPENARLDVLVDDEILAERVATAMPETNCFGTGREYFAHARNTVGSAETGASYVAPVWLATPD
ncbi:phosphogluconate dehydratase [Martelella sp. HB161492]|uniref:phosphogluconate dehydratase n=1 Tax=Martelella sp. HB161492 TaxID=2720726 RepID=UPI0015908825|nr:phosphogluconate dehydratase [Martelella sp. HB161492]